MPKKSLMSESKKTFDQPISVQNIRIYYLQCYFFILQDKDSFEAFSGSGQSLRSKGKSKGRR